ncbi:MAG: UDP-N-acetylmuramoyl-tripeptide--D-alanyl-D-alanine ligase, partial [Actinomycetes bacterium]
LVAGPYYLAGARAAGAGAALVEREVDADLPQVVVADTVAGLSSLAHHVVTRARRSGLVVVGVTGSSGKTSTKDLLAQVLAGAGPTVAPPGSFNNEIGAPLTACRVDDRTRFLVSEMGARGVGHIAALARVTPPDIGAVLNVGHAHVGEFGSVEGIAEAKGELVEALGETGWAVLNADDPRVLAMAQRTRARVATFSAVGDPGANGAALRVWAAEITPDDLQRFSFTLNAAGAAYGSAQVALGVLGEHQVSNALAAAAVALAAGLGLDDIAAALTRARPLSRWRMELTTRPDGLAVLNDAYNANPDSMRAALAALRGLRRPEGRLVAVLGDMLELGESSRTEHHELGRLAATLGIDEVDAVGAFAGDVAAGVAAAGGRARYFEDKDTLTRHLRATLGSADVVLVKASRGLALETVAEALAAADDEGVRP